MEIEEIEIRGEMWRERAGGWCEIDWPEGVKRGSIEFFEFKDSKRCLNNANWYRENDGRDVNRPIVQPFYVEIT